MVSAIAGQPQVRPVDGLLKARLEKVASGILPDVEPGFQPGGDKP